jgi:DMSO reductase anchor subunit
MMGYQSAVVGAVGRGGQRGPTELPQAGLGIASAAVAAIGGVSMGWMTIVIRSIADVAPDAGTEGTPLSYTIGIWLFGTVVLSLCGIALGIGGIRQQNRKHHLALVGLIANIVLPIVILFTSMLDAMYAQDMPAPPHPATHAFDPAAWQSPLARLFQIATIGLAVGLIAYYRNRRQARTDISSCATCRKPLPNSAKFCRRCGTAVAT